MERQELFRIKVVSNTLLTALQQETGRTPQEIHGHGQGCVSCTTDYCLRSIKDLLKEQEGDNWNNFVDTDHYPVLSRDQIHLVFTTMEYVMRQRANPMGAYFTRMGYNNRIFEKSLTLLNNKH